MKTLSKQAIQQDIKELQKKLEEIHPNPYKYISKRDFTTLLNRNTRNIDSIKDLGLAIMTTLPKLRDGHTYLKLSDEVLGTETIMFRIKYLYDGYYLTKASPILSNYLGSKLIAINDYNIAELEERFKIFIPQENETSTRYYLPSKIIEPVILEFLNIKQDKEIIITLERSGKQISKKIKSEDYKNKKMLSIWDQLDNIPQTLKIKDSYWYTELEDIEAFYFQYNVCKERKDLQISKIIEKIKDSKLKNIIIDLRNNKGGDSDVLKPLVMFLKTVNDQYKVFVITGSDTYSSGIINLLELSNIPNTISLGAIPHGNPTHYGEIKSFILPNSKLEVITSSNIFRFKGYKLGDPFRPTHIVQSQIQDLLEGRDTQIEYLSKLSGN